MVIALIITLIIANVEALGIQAAARVMGYENRLIDQSRVHVMDGWHGFIDTVENVEYSVCSQCGIAVRDLVRRRISRFIRSVTLFARIFSQCDDGRSMYTSVSSIPSPTFLAASFSFIARRSSTTSFVRWKRVRKYLPVKPACRFREIIKDAMFRVVEYSVRIQ